MEYYLEIGWHGYGFMPYIKGVVNKIDKSKINFNNYFITIDTFKKNYKDYSNWEMCDYKKFLTK